MKKAGIIGGSGFIGSYITKQFLDHGFQVKVSTTDITRKDKYEHLMVFNHSENLYISELDVTDKNALKDFVSDCDVVIHSGTPFILDFEDPKTQLFDPTIKGTENFLEVINNTPSIEKVVFVASVAAYNTNFPFPAGTKSFTDTFNETDVKFTSNESHPYAQAKFLANQAVENFIKKNSDLHFEISSVSPVMVIGKALSIREDSTSGNIQFLIKNNMAPNDFMKAIFDNDVPFAMVNVEDVAIATYKTANKKGLHGKNYLLSSETYKASDIHAMLNHKAPKENPIVIYQNNLAKHDLGMQFKPVKEALNSYSN
ncbi:NAD-dependent epimerase/dehydratase family protein [Mariniflexile gromovii]|uniref:NAD-dependent epimerase/dehydratase family protein n=1 Tax=Mariniflexile gromovii TaxID=362523 RepID=A0ABS4BU50_9FLAO|nr:NAD-dependent epimerase/dehydratase family protein [Mariniflexile gromovii]MBP0903928.1 NAD-dependent epimerase/dehydratase family protein [Mariniflexile gromovii]